MVTTLVSLIILGVVALVVVLNVSDAETGDNEPDIDEIVENSYKTEEITTDLQDGSFVRIQFQIVTNGEKAKEELKKREFQLQNILIKELATMDEENFKTGLSNLEKTIALKLNELMQDGKVISVYTINKVLQ